MSDAELALRITYLERAQDDNMKSRRYMHNMLEDMGAKMSGLERSAARFEADLQHRNGKDSTTLGWLEGVDERLKTIERLVWIAVGGVVVIGGLTTLIGGNIMKLLSH